MANVVPIGAALQRRRSGEAVDMRDLEQAFLALTAIDRASAAAPDLKDNPFLRKARIAIHREYCALFALLPPGD